MNIHTFHWQELVTLWEHGPMLILTATGLWAVCFYILVSSFQNPRFKWCAAQGGSTPQRELDLLGFSPSNPGIPSRLATVPWNESQEDPTTSKLPFPPVPAPFWLWSIHPLWESSQWSQPQRRGTGRDSRWSNGLVSPCFLSILYISKLDLYRLNSRRL